MTEPAPAAFCTHCGTRLEPGVSFCTACGTAAGPAEPATTTTPTGVAAHQPTAARPVEHPATWEPMAGSPDAAPVASGGWTGGPTDGWGEPAYADAVPGRQGSRSRLATGGVVLLVLAVVLAGVGLLAIRRTSAGSPHAAPTPSAVQPGTTANPMPTYAPGPTYDLPTPSPTPSPSPSRVTSPDGLVTYSAVTDSPYAEDVAALLDTYFGGINDRNWDRALSAYDPSGQAVRPGAPGARQRFIDDVSTSIDSAVTIWSISPAYDAAVSEGLLVHLGMTSHQAADKGPSPGETCTNWQLTYELSPMPAGGWWLYSARPSSHTAC